VALTALIWMILNQSWNLQLGIGGIWNFGQLALFAIGGYGAALVSLHSGLPPWLAMIVGGLAAALAFMQWNGRPFILALENGFYYLLRTKLYLWNNEQKKPSRKPETSNLKPASQVYIPKLSDSKLHELAWSLDIKERIAAGVARDDERLGGVIAPIRTAREARV